MARENNAIMFYLEHRYYGKGGFKRSAKVKVVVNDL